MGVGGEAQVPQQREEEQMETGTEGPGPSGGQMENSRAVEKLRQNVIFGRSGKGN